MDTNTTGRKRAGLVMRKVSQWARHSPGSISTPSQNVMEPYSRDSYFWRR